MKLYTSFLCLATATIGSAQTINIIAHQDDDLLFLNPDIMHDIESGRSVRTVVLTAGDAGNDESYWLSREAGSRAAYAKMSGSGNDWTSSDVGIQGFSIPQFTLDSNPDISLVFLRLPDGNNGGEGFGKGSLQQLWQGSIPSLDSYTGSSYSKDDLVDVIRQLVQTFDHDRVNTQDFVHGYGEGDHSDHYTTGYFVQEAIDCGEGVTLASYMGYPVVSLPTNLDESDLNQKRDVFYTYAAHDRNVCNSEETCSDRDEGQWVQRSYVVDSLSLSACGSEDDESPSETTIYRHVTVSGACPSPSNLIQHTPITPSSMTVPATTASQESETPATQTPSEAGALPTQLLFDGASTKGMVHSVALCILAAVAFAISAF